MLTPYPLTDTMNVIVRDLTAALRATRPKDEHLLDLIRYTRFVSEELAVNAKLLNCTEAEGFKNPTMALLYEKTYTTVSEVRYIKHWPCLTGNPSDYQQVTNEITARLLRSQMRLV